MNANVLPNTPFLKSYHHKKKKRATTIFGTERKLGLERDVEIANIVPNV
jgi:hypothetical protein